MIFKFKKINNESGIVLFIVLMTSIIMMIFSLAVLTQSVNEINYAQQQIDQITCDQLRKGVFWEAESTGALPASYNTPLTNGRIYKITTGGAGTALSPWVVSCAYDTT